MFGLIVKMTLGAAVSYTIIPAMGVYGILPLSVALMASAGSFVPAYKAARDL